ncbi:MAG: hypothetical protein AB7U29_15600 [Desulfobulbus sp.]
MSEIRMPDIVWRWGNAATEGKKPLRIELFRAELWKSSWNPFKKTMHPHPPLGSREYWQKYFRLRVDGRWHGQDGYKFSFFILEQALRIAEQLHGEQA